MKVIKQIGNRYTIGYDRGSFDDWCVYVVEPNGRKFAPRDVQYFSFFQKLANEFTRERVYADFISIYDAVTGVIETATLEQITSISKAYGSKIADEVEMNFTVIYAGMVAERNKKGTILKERIKRLGFHQAVIDGESPSYAANFSRGKRAKEIASVCESKGF